MDPMMKRWYDEVEEKGLSLEDIERSLNYAKDLTEGLEKVRSFPQGVTVFGSARLKEHDPYYQQAYELGKMLAAAGHPVITGGGPGIMEAANRGAYESGGRSIGLNIYLPTEQDLNRYTTDNMEFKYFFARKVMLTFSAKVYVFFPGGFGTLDEFSEILELVHTDKVPRVPIFLIGQEFWNGLDRYFMDEMERRSLINPGARSLYTITDYINQVVEAANEIEYVDTSGVMRKAIDKAL